MNLIFTILNILFSNDFYSVFDKIIKHRIEIIGLNLFSLTLYQESLLNTIKIIILSGMNKEPTP